MNRVAECVAKLQELFDAFKKGDQARLEAIAHEISQSEHAADLTKNDIRNNLPKGLFLPVDRGNLLSILAIQDGIADKCEDIGILLSLRNLQMLKELEPDFKAFLEKNLEAFEVARSIIRKLDELLETSFGGMEAERVREMVEDVAYKEHEADLIQQSLLKKLFNAEKKLSYAAFIQWLRLVEQVGAVANLSENLGNRVRTTLELK